MADRMRDRGAAAGLLSAMLMLPAAASADAVLDGTTGSTGSFSGDFEIPAAVGRQEGGNLFHSFARFSVLRGESATFTGPGGIDNVISRVTGGEVSTIDGPLASTIPGADFFFLNPAGVVFGPEASLDIDGSFHVSTADELRFADGTRFSASDPAASSFTIAAPEAFGFLGADAGTIKLRGPSGLFLDTPDVAPFDTTISLVGGDIIVDQTEIRFLDPETATGPDDFERGNVNMVAMSREGQVSLDGRPSAAAQGTISIIGRGIDLSSNNGGGRVRIHAGDLIIDEGFIVSDNGSADSASSNNGNGPKSGGIEIDAQRVSVFNGGLIQSNAFGEGDGGNIVLRLGELDVIHSIDAEETRISSDTEGAGRAGDISILGAHRVTIQGDQRFRDPKPTEISSDVANDAAATGRAGNIFVAADQVIIRNNGEISSSTQGPGDAGSVTIEAGHVSLEEGGQVNSSVVAETGSTGSGGSITVNARDEIVITGEGPFNPRMMKPEPSGIFTSSEDDNGGPAGDVRVTAPVIRLADRGEISSESFNASPGGEVRVSFTDLLEVDDAEITTKADFANAGNIDVFGTGVINLRNQGEISTTVPGEGSAGNAGDISVSSASIVLNAGIIQANGVQGQGGNIEISAGDTLIRTADSVIEALSQLGIDGTVSIDAPAEDVLQSLDALPTDFLDASSLLREDCAARARAGDRGGSLVGEGGGGIAPTPDQPLPGAYSDMTARASSVVREARLKSLSTCAENGS